jgi:hypothetical protein
MADPTGRAFLLALCRVVVIKKRHPPRHIPLSFVIERLFSSTVKNDEVLVSERKGHSSVSPLDATTQEGLELSRKLAGNLEKILDSQNAGLL